MHQQSYPFEQGPVKEKMIKKVEEMTDDDNEGKEKDEEGGSGDRDNWVLICGGEDGNEESEEWDEEDGLGKDDEETEKDGGNEDDNEEEELGGTWSRGDGLELNQEGIE